jgi:hypothetical protein
MGQINIGRMILGAIVMAAILFVIEGFINGAILGADWDAWVKDLGPLNHAPSFAGGMVIWAIISLLHGLVGLWIYVGIRPRYGAGPKTAALAGLLLWIPGFLTHALSQFALGDIPSRIIVVGSIGGLVAVLVATVAGAALYREGSAGMEHVPSARSP